MRTIPGVLAATAAAHPAAEAVVDGDVRLTWAQLHDRVRTLARFFVAEGIAPGDRVAVQAPNTHHWVLAALGALHAGATLVPVSTRFTGFEALDVVVRSRARALVVAGPFLGVDRLAELRAAAGTGGLPELHTVLRVPTGEGGGHDGSGHDGSGHDGSGHDGSGHDVEWTEVDGIAARVPLAEVDARAAALRPEDVSDILFTSGTTGTSKGAMSSHAQALAVAQAWAECGELTSADRYLVVNPFFHSFGYKAGILACLLSGAAIVPQAVFDTDRALDVVERERITVLPGPPTLYRSLLDAPARSDRDLSTLRLAVTGAATVPVALVEAMQRDLSFTTVLTAYGLTEAVVATMCRPGDDPDTVAHTCGRATAGFEVRVAEGSGEVLLRGPNVMLGYLDDPAATRGAIDDEGWLHTGDVGRLDGRGYLTIVDRLKDMYICGGFNVYPAEVEQTIARLDGVLDSAVVGVADGRLGEVGRAYVVPRAGAALSAEDVVAFCRSRLAGYKVPRQVEFLAGLPRNAGGKVLKRELREGVR